MSTALMDVQRPLQLYLESVIDYAFHALDAEGRVADWNRGAQRMLGYAASDAIGLPWSAFYPEDARAAREPHQHLNAARSGGVWEGECWRVRKDGSLLRCYVVLTSLVNERRELQGFAAVTRDLTEPRRLAQQLQDQRRRLRSILETAVDAVVIIDEHGVIEHFNPAGERMFGYTADEVIGRNVNLLMPQPFADEHTGYIQHYLRTGRAKVIGIGREVQARRKDGSLFPADLAVSEFYDGKPLFTGILRDISDRKAMEAEVLHSAEAEQRRIGQELHDDAQQQLAGLTMIARHAADALGALTHLDPRLTEIHGRVERVVKGLRDANQSLRELARGLVPLQIDAHGLHEALTRLAGQVQELHAVTCRFVADSTADVNDSQAATHLYRITQEAVNNALRHGKATAIDIKLKFSDRMIVLEIVDNGVGIPEVRETFGRGLQIMAYRAGLIGAVLTVRRGEQGGTIVSCGLPQP